MGDTRSAKREVLDVIRDLSRVVRGCPRELWIETRVADMTPVSSAVLMYVSIHSFFHWAIPGLGAVILEDIQPNNKPLMPADSVSNQTNSPGFRRFFSRRRETSLRSSSSSSMLSRFDSNGSSDVDAMVSRGISVVDASVFMRT